MAADRITIVPYDPAWPHAFQRERDALGDVLGPIALRIEHNGSTAVPGLAAKPVIDIQISVARLTPLTTYADPLATLGYLHMPHEDDSWCPFFYRAADPPQPPYRIHVHVVEAGGREERRTLAFRDRLRQDAHTAREYERLKRTLAAAHDGRTPASMEAYAQGKTGFIRRVLGEL